MNSSSRFTGNMYQSLSESSTFTLHSIPYAQMNETAPDSGSSMADWRRLSAHTSQTAKEGIDRHRRDEVEFVEDITCYRSVHCWSTYYEAAMIARYLNARHNITAFSVQQRQEVFYVSIDYTDIEVEPLDPPDAEGPIIFVS